VKETTEDKGFAGAHGIAWRGYMGILIESSEREEKTEEATCAGLTAELAISGTWGRSLDTYGMLRVLSVW
jgi:hypothetical protein